ncbi:MAG TPA: 50S ribosomal protein L1, partial [Patescibacteria group bacterium]|nr:50S ribosomal protein L1 [Patescibacteria group bacterium]
TQTAQAVRGNVQLPHGTGKKARILVFAAGSAAAEATQAGATVADTATLTQIEKGSIPFDLVLATPEQMPKIAKFARVLGVRGLMPNPRAGTVTEEVGKMIEARNKGLIDFKNENALLHLSIGKASFKKGQLKDNIVAVFTAVVAAKPAKTSGEFIRQVTLSSTMGPGIKVDPQSINPST